MIQGVNGELDVFIVSKSENSNAEMIAVEPSKPWPVDYFGVNKFIIQRCHKVCIRRGGALSEISPYWHFQRLYSVATVYTQRSLYMHINKMELSLMEIINQIKQMFSVTETVKMTNSLKNNLKDLLQVIQ